VKVTAAAITALVLALWGTGTLAQPDGARQAELVHMLRHDCGSCHGMTLAGGLGPSLLPESLAGKPEAALSATILRGRPGTPMPPWAGILSDADAAWLVQQLVKGIPDAQ
jgi:cytochrome c55X